MRKSSSSAVTPMLLTVREEVIRNFDARVARPADDYRILVTTEVLAEGVSLHRANVVLNYDIPWNPTRLIQRVGRVNRLDTAHGQIPHSTFSRRTEATTSLSSVRPPRLRSKPLSMLGADAESSLRRARKSRAMTSSKLFAKNTITGEDEQQEKRTPIPQPYPPHSRRAALAFRSSSGCQKNPLRPRGENRRTCARAAHLFPQRPAGEILYRRAGWSGPRTRLLRHCALAHLRRRRPSRRIVADFYPLLDRNKSCPLMLPPLRMATASLSAQRARHRRETSATPAHERSSQLPQLHRGRRAVHPPGRSTARRRRASAPHAKKTR